MNIFMNKIIIVAFVLMNIYAYGSEATMQTTPIEAPITPLTVQDWARVLREQREQRQAERRNAVDAQIRLRQGLGVLDNAAHRLEFPKN